MSRRVLAVTGGHPFDADAFATALDAVGRLAGADVEHVAHPTDRLHPDRLGADAVLLYDMPGLAFRRDDDPELVPPPPGTVEGWEALLAAGVGVVALHHSIASWPAWEGWADVVGGRFHYLPGRLRGHDWPDSGYAFDVRQTLQVAQPDHPVCAGLPASFELTDETYCCPVFADEVEVLLTTDAPLDDAHHASARLAVLGERGSREGWSHPPGAPLAAWTHTVDRSRVVYVQPGDGPSAFADPHWRRLVANALAWVASPHA